MTARYRQMTDPATSDHPIGMAQLSTPPFGTRPVSPTVMRGLLEHAAESGNPHPKKLLRDRDGRPVTSRCYDHIWARIGKELPWVVAQGISMRWPRHATLTWIGRTFSYTVAHAYAEHPGKNPRGTATYVKAHVHEIAAALAVPTGEAHPLAPGFRPNTQDSPHTDPPIGGTRS